MQRREKMKNNHKIEKKTQNKKISKVLGLS